MDWSGLLTFLSAPAGLAVKGMLVAAFLDFATGSYAALTDGTFSVDAIAAFVRKHLLGRVFPCSTLLLVGYFTGDAVILAAGIAAATAYYVETAGSVLGNFSPPKESDLKENLPAATVNPVPTE
jgi:hypothetical protein